jgi:hypothetical protein
MKQGSKMGDKSFLLVSVLVLTILSAVGAVAIMVYGRSPPSPFAERLFDTFISLTGAGFFALLGLLGADRYSSNHR